MRAEELRQAFTKFFAERGHVDMPAASLVSNDPTVLFTIAGMVQFKPYFLGESPPPHPRLTTIQPCLRNNDIEVVGTTPRHCTFFEMLGNFSFGDYFKEKAIPWAWEFVTDVLGFDPARLWVTVHHTDDEAAEIWTSTTPVRPERIQRLGDDNFWKMGETGPCGPSSEIFFDLGADGPDGGPAAPGAEHSARYTEVWNLVFTQYDRASDGTLSPLPKSNIDTGAGLDRLLVVLQGVPHVQAIDCVAPILAEAARLTGQAVGEDPRVDTGLRIIADHSRAFTFAVADGVFPSNEGRGYVLRRLIRRAVLRAHQLGRREIMGDALVDAVVGTMGGAYPKIARDRERIKTVVVHEEEAFLRTLRQGTAILEEELASGVSSIAGEVAFRLHDTYGFPFELTKEVAAEHGLEVDEAGYEQAMEAQRRRAREAGKEIATTPEETASAWRRLRATHGATRFLGYETTESDSVVLAMVESAVDSSFSNIDGESAPEGTQLVEVFLDVTPFYAEGGGQVGDTGFLTSSSGRMRVLDTTEVAEGLTRHLGYLLEGTLVQAEGVRAEVDVERRDAIRRNHTGTHLLHWALREVLGEHVRQQGSLVAPDRLRFDFSHFGPVSTDELRRIEDLVNVHVIADEPVETVEASRSEAEGAGVIAFFGDKYGERVRVVHAGHESVELCGGTHVHALGMIGPLRILSEASIGANTRRIEAVTGAASLARIREADRTLLAAAELLRSTPDEVPTALTRLVTRQRSLEDELTQVRLGRLGELADSLAAGAEEGIVVARADDLDPNALRELALRVRDRAGISAVGLVGVVGSERASIVVATAKDGSVDARQVASSAAELVGGGGGGSKELATAGGRDVSGASAALGRLRSLLAPGA